MRSVTVHTYALVPVPAGTITRVIRRLIGSSHFSPALADQSRLSKGETNYSREPAGAADISKPKAGKLNNFNAVMSAGAAFSNHSFPTIKGLNCTFIRILSNI